MFSVADLIKRLEETGEIAKHAEKNVFSTIPAFSAVFS
jgi:hypothetical protein